MASPFDTPDSPLLIEEANTITGGVVSNAEPHLLQPHQSAYLLNVQPYVDGRRQKLNGVDAIGTAGVNTPHGLWAFEAPLLGLRQLIAVYGSGAGGAAVYSTPGTGSMVSRATLDGLNDNACNAVIGRGLGKSTLFISNCEPSPSNVSLPYANIVGLQSDFNYTKCNWSGTNILARSLAWFQGRLWAWNSCNTDAGPDYLRWSAPLNGFDFSNGQTLQVDPDTGDEGTAIVPLRDSTPRMILFKNQSTWLFEFYWTTEGWIPTSANTLDTTNSIVRPITLETGCVAPRAAIWAPGLQGADVLFLSREGIRSLTRSLTDSQAGVGLPLSWRIQPIIDRINWAAAHRSVAYTWDNVAYFAVPLDESTYNNFIIAYDLNRDAFFFQDWAANGFAAATLGSARKFYFLGTGASPVTESYSSGYTLGHHIYETDTGAIGPGISPIVMEEQTKAFTFNTDNSPGGGLKNRKRWAWFDIAAQAAATTCTLTISYKVDDDDEWTIYSYIPIEAGDACPLLPVTLPFGFSSARFIHYRTSLDRVRPGYKIQFKIRDESSYAQCKIQQFAVAAYPKPVVFS